MINTEDKKKWWIGRNSNKMKEVTSKSEVKEK
jgi:hypothetical protein